MLSHNNVMNKKSPLKNLLAKNIKKHRSKCKLTQEQAAERAGITVKYWQRLEMVSQIDLPSLPTLAKIARTLNTNIDRLLIK